MKRKCALKSPRSVFASPYLNYISADVTRMLHACKRQRHPGKHVGHLTPTHGGAEGPTKSGPEAASPLRFHLSALTCKVCCAGVKGMRVLKTTQSGYEGFLHDKYTILKDTSERMMASSVTATWRQVLWLALCPLRCLAGTVCDRHLPVV